MKSVQCTIVLCLLAITMTLLACSPAPRDSPIAADILTSWNDGASRQTIIDFVARVTTEGSVDFVPPARRIATFDNDGTLWAEDRKSVV